MPLWKQGKRPPGRFPCLTVHGFIPFLDENAISLPDGNPEIVMGLGSGLKLALFCAATKIISDISINVVSAVSVAHLSISDTAFKCKSTFL